MSTTRSGKIPRSRLDDGTALYDSRVIVEFLDNASPISPDPGRRARPCRRASLGALADACSTPAVWCATESLRDRKDAARIDDKQLADARGCEQM